METEGEIISFNYIVNTVLCSSPVSPNNATWLPVNPTSSGEMTRRFLPAVGFSSVCGTDELTKLLTTSDKVYSTLTRFRRP